MSFTRVIGKIIRYLLIMMIIISYTITRFPEIMISRKRNTIYTMNSILTVYYEALS